MAPPSEIQTFQKEIAEQAKSGNIDFVKTASGDVRPQPIEPSEPLINTLVKYFTAPFLNLVLHYISKMNEGKKDNLYTLDIFFARHRYAKYLILVLDGICTLIILVVVGLVVLRGLGIIKF